MKRGGELPMAALRGNGLLLIHTSLNTPMMYTHSHRVHPYVSHMLPTPQTTIL